MMKKSLTVITVILACASIAFAAENVLQKLDKNHDGKVSKKEYMDAIAVAFDKLDKNRDGVLTKEEIQLNKKIDAEKFMEEVDENRDGKIIKEEFEKAAKRRFTAIDKNMSGDIDKEEWDSYYSGPLKKKKIPPFDKSKSNIANQRDLGADRSELYSPFSLFSF